MKEQEIDFVFPKDDQELIKECKEDMQIFGWILIKEEEVLTEKGVEGIKLLFKIK
jgi:hypothetical protein